MLKGVVQTERDINNKKQREDAEDIKALIRVILKRSQTAIVSIAHRPSYSQCKD